MRTPLSSASLQRHALLRRALLQAGDVQQLAIKHIVPYFVRERFLWRLQQSAQQDNLVVKGAALLPLWLGAQARYSPHLDLQKQDNRLNIDTHDLRQRLQAIAQHDAQASDGLQFLPDHLSLQAESHPSGYVATHAVVAVWFGRQQLQLHLHVSPQLTALLPLETYQLPALLGAQAAWRQATPPSPYSNLPPLPDVQIRGVRLLQVFGEKLQTLLALHARQATTPPRYQDIYDLDMLLQHCSFSASTLYSTLQLICTYRQTAPPTALPSSLQPTPTQLTLWEAGWRAARRSWGLPMPNPTGPKNAAAETSTTYAATSARLAAFLEPLCAAFTRQHAGLAQWPPGGPWQS